MAGEGRAQRVGAIIAGVLVALLAPVATIAVWLRWRVLDQEWTVARLRPMGTDDRVRDDIVTIITRQLETRLAAFEQSSKLDAIRPMIDALGGVPAAAAAIGPQVRAFVFSDHFEPVWTMLLTTGFPHAVAMLQGKADPLLAASGGDVTLSAAPLAMAIDQETSGVAGDLIGMLGDPSLSITLFHLRALPYLEFLARNATLIAVGSSLILLLSLVSLFILARNRWNALLWTAGGTILAFIGASILIETEAEKRLNRVHDASAHDIARVVANTMIAALFDHFVIIVIALAVVMLVAFITPRWLLPRKHPETESATPGLASGAPPAG